MVHVVPMCVQMSVCLLCINILCKGLPGLVLPSLVSQTHFTEVSLATEELYLNHLQSLLDIVSQPLSSSLSLQAQLTLLSNGCLSPSQQDLSLVFWKLGEKREGQIAVS